jgi:hypothetical protein
VSARSFAESESTNTVISVRDFRCYHSGSRASFALQSYMIQCSSKAGKPILLPENDTSTRNHYDSLKSNETPSTPTSASERAGIQHTSIRLFLLLVVIMDCSYRGFVRMGRKSVIH